MKFALGSLIFTLVIVYSYSSRYRSRYTPGVGFTRKHTSDLENSQLFESSETSPRRDPSRYARDRHDRDRYDRFESEEDEYDYDEEEPVDSSHRNSRYSRRLSSKQQKPQDNGFSPPMFGSFPSLGSGSRPGFSGAYGGGFAGNGQSGNFAAGFAQAFSNGGFASGFGGGFTGGSRSAKRRSDSEESDNYDREQSGRRRKAQYRG